VAGVLARLHEESARADPPAVARVRAREAELGTKVYGRERAELYGGAPLAIKREVGDLLYAFALARRPRLSVEFGASIGISTIYLAAALRDLGGTGRLIATELDREKAARAECHLAQAGLADLVEVRTGDALETLRDLPGLVELLFLDGWNDLYLAVLELLEPRMVPDALVLADLSPDDPNLARYGAHMRAPDSGYATITVPLDAGVVVSSRLTSS
jgi:predicted O-methyltransferase YrrM